MKSITHHCRRTNSIGTLVAVCGAALVGGLVLSGCGSSKGAAVQSTTSATVAATTTTATGTTGATPAASASFQAYQSCLQSHGVTFPAGGGFRRGGATGSTGASGSIGASGATGATGASGTTGPRGFGRRPLTKAQQAAFNACASLRPAGGFGGGFGGGAGGGGFANNPAFQKFQACLKQHGVQTGGAGGAQPDQSSPEFQTALNACRSLLPNRGSGGGPGFGGGAPPAGSGGQGGSSAFTQFQACLRSHGVDPNARGGQSQAKTQAALNACRKLLPAGGAGTSASSTTTTTG